MDPDDIAYRKSVRNMAVVLAAILITIFAAISIPPLIAPSHDAFQTSVSFASPFGFTMHLTLNSKSISPDGSVQINGWLNNSSNAPLNVSAANSWAYSPGGLSSNPCAAGWPIGIGVLKGHYTGDNYTQGAPLQLTQPACSGNRSITPPGYFLFYPLSSRVLVSINDAPAFWVLQGALSFGEGALIPNTLTGVSGRLPAGVYTAVLADEWGDVVTASFLVS